MNVLYINLFWMSFNIYLALLPLFFCWLFFFIKAKIRWIFFVLWLVYLPNSIYVITDLAHLIEQWDLVLGGQKLTLILQYSILEAIGLLAFLVGLSPLERLLLRSFRHSIALVNGILVGYMMLLGVIMVLGKFERVNSWDIFLNPHGVVEGSLAIITSREYVLISVLLGIFTNCFYFLFRRPMHRRKKRARNVS